ncbi:MAG: tyrosine-protein phosphatase [Halanaerobiales bacterium]
MEAKKMIDIHTHILPGFDDGVESRKEALRAVQNLIKDGISGLVATPHVGRGGNTKPSPVRKMVKQLQDLLVEENRNFTIYPGSEIMMYPRLGRDLSKGQILPINDGLYLLIEIPAGFIPNFCSNVFYDLRVMGFRPIICHPERNLALIKNSEYLYRWLEKGAFAQLNAGSLLGYYGRRVQEAAEIFIRKKCVQLIASDLHSDGRRSECMGSALQRVEELAGPEMVELFRMNSQLVIEDKVLEMPEPEPLTAGSFFHRIKGFFSQVSSV